MYSIKPMRGLSHSIRNLSKRIRLQIIKFVWLSTTDLVENHKQAQTANNYWIVRKSPIFLQLDARS